MSECMSKWQPLARTGNARPHMIPATGQVSADNPYYFWLGREVATAPIEAARQRAADGIFLDRIEGGLFPRLKLQTSN